MSDAFSNDDPTTRKISLERLLREAPFDVRVHRDLFLVNRQLGNEVIATIYANHILEGLEQALHSELDTGTVDPDYGLSDRFEEADLKSYMGIFQGTEQEGRARRLLECERDISTLRSANYQGTNWHRVREFLKSLGQLEPISIATNQLVKNVRSISAENVEFLIEAAKAGNFDPYDTGEALLWFERTGKGIDIANRLEYFRIVRRYHTEYNLMEGYWRNGAFDDVKFGIHQRFDHVLGKESDGLTLEQKSSLLVSRNALKARLGNQDYESLIAQIIDPERLRAVMTEQESDRLTSFLGSYDRLGDLPIHERIMPVDSNNECYVVEIQLPDQRVLKTFVKMFNQKRNHEEYESESRLKTEFGIELKEYGLDVGSNIANASVAGYDVLMMSFLNGRNLDAILAKGPTVPEMHLESTIDSLAKVHQVSKKVGSLRPAFERLEYKCVEQFYKDYFRKKVFGRMLRFLGIDFSTKVGDKRLDEYLMESMSGIIAQLTHATIADPVYFKQAHPRNWVIVNGASIPVDFEGLIVSCPYVDLAYLNEYGRRDDQDNIVGYTAEENRKKRVESYFAKRSDYSKSPFDCNWEMYNAARLFSHIIFIGSAARDMSIASETGQNKKEAQSRMNYHLTQALELANQLPEGGSIVRGLSELGLLSKR